MPNPENLAIAPIAAASAIITAGLPNVADQSLVEFHDMFATAEAQGADEVDEETQELCTTLLADDNIQSMASVAEREGPDERKLARTVHRLAELTTIADRWCRHTLEESLTLLPSVDLLLYVDSSSYDETPLTASTRASVAAPIVGVD